MPNLLRLAALINLLALVALILAIELWLLPLRPGGSWFVLRALPLLLALRGYLHGRRYTYQWMSLLVWLYFTTGVLRAWSESATEVWLGGGEAALALSLFTLCCIQARLAAPSRTGQGPAT